MKLIELALTSLLAHLSRAINEQGMHWLVGNTADTPAIERNTDLCWKETIHVLWQSNDIKTNVKRIAASDKFLHTVD